MGFEKQAGIGIPDLTQTTIYNFYMLEHCCEVLTAFLINWEVTDIRKHVTWLRGSREAGWDSRVNIKEGGLKTLYETVVNKAKRKLQRAYDGGGWITVLPIYQDGTEISREDLRYSLRHHLDITLQEHPLPLPPFQHVMSEENCSKCIMNDIARTRVSYVSTKIPQTRKWGICTAWSIPQIQ